MTAIISDDLRIARTQFLVELADKNAGNVTPDQLLTAVGGSQKLLLNVLWNARRSGYVDVNQVRDGKKISRWEIKVTGKRPSVAGDLRLGGKSDKPKVAKPKAVKTAKAAKAASAVKTPKAKAVKSDEAIRAANLAKMKKVSAKLAKKTATKKKKTVDYVEDTFGTSGEIATSFNIDPSWDSVEGLDIQKLVA